MRWILVRTIVAALVIGTARNGSAAEPGPDGMTTSELRDFLHALQTAVRHGDANHVARYMYFPLRVNSEKSVTHSYSGVTFEKKFDQIFTPSLRRAVLAQDSAQITRSPRGAMMAEGRVSIANVCLDRNCTKRKICVTAINLGDPAKPPVPAVPPHPHR